VLYESLKASTDKLQQVINATTLIIIGTQKYDHGLSDILHNELHWLSVPQRVKFKLGTMMFRCLHHSVLRYLSNFCSRSRMSPLVVNYGWSARRHLVVVPRYNRSTYGRRAFSVN